MSEWRSSTREQPGIKSDLQVTRSFREGEPGVGGPGPVLGTKETTPGQLVGLCFNSDTMWQQWLRGQRRSIRLLVFCLTLLIGDYLRLLTLPLRKALGFPHWARVQVCMRAPGRGVDGRKWPGPRKENLPFLSFQISYC